MEKIYKSSALLAKTFLFISLTGFYMLLNAAYPSLYSPVGTPLFQAAEGYETIVDNEHFVSSKTGLMQFIMDADALKIEGMNLENSASKEARILYLKQLRDLEERNKALERDVLQSIRILKAKKLYNELGALAASPSPVIRAAASFERQNNDAADAAGSTQLTYDELQRSLETLRQELDKSREIQAQDVGCLNDITAINYLMLRAENFKRERDFCKAYEACEQIVEYEYTAGRSCGKEDPRYQKWSSASLAYRTEMMELFKDSCRR